MFPVPAGVRNRSPDFLIYCNMEPDQINLSFAQLLERLELSHGKLEGRDRDAVALFPEYHVDNREFPLPTANDAPTSINQFLRSGLIDEHGRQSEIPKFPTYKDGLASFGWSMWPYYKPEGQGWLGAGAFASVVLAFHAQDIDQPPQRRRLAALKELELTEENYSMIWTEMCILRSVHHENIVEFFGAFAETHTRVEKEEEQPKKKFGPAKPSKADAKFMSERPGRWDTDTPSTSAGSKRKRSPSPAPAPSTRMWLIMEYANAGNLSERIIKHCFNCLPESTALLFGKQILSAIAYLHGKGIVHIDLHTGNIILTYTNHGNEKSLLCNFGLSHISGVNNQFIPPWNFMVRRDIQGVVQIIKDMLVTYKATKPVHELPVLSGATKEVIASSTTTSADLMALPWFTQAIVAPEPGSGRHSLVTARPPPPFPEKERVLSVAASSYRYEPVSRTPFADLLADLPQETTSSRATHLPRVTGPGNASAHWPPAYNKPPKPKRRTTDQEIEHPRSPPPTPGPDSRARHAVEIDYDNPQPGPSGIGATSSQLMPPPPPRRSRSRSSSPVSPKKK